jgi:sphingomyelin phosphodiesterase
MKKLKNFMKYLIFILILSSISTINHNSFDDGPLNLQEFEEIKLKTQEFTNFIINIQKENTSKFLPSYSDASPHKDSLFCKTCLWFYNEIHDFLMKKYGIKALFQFITDICALGLNKNVCNEYINLYAPKIYDSIIDHYFNGLFICSSLKVCKDEHFIKLKADDYARDLLKDKPSNFEKIKLDLEAPQWKMLHVSDIHIDSLYEEGSKGRCSDPLCCRSGSSYGEDRAGYWGYLGKCDIPLRTVDAFTRQVVQDIKPDFIVWTGDNPPHDPWTGSQDSAFNATAEFTNLLKKYNYTLPIYPAMGNHEAYPNDEYNPFGDPDKYILEKYANIFKDWLGEDAYDTFSKYGYYTKLHPNSNLRIVSTNCLLCDSLNFNLIKNPTDPKGEVTWLEKTLRDAEKNGEVVYILRHIPLGDGFFLEECARRYQAIFDRFEHIIRGQFYGHTHNDEIKIMHSYFNHNHTTGVNFIAPSMTT